MLYALLCLGLTLLLFKFFPKVMWSLVAIALALIGWIIFINAHPAHTAGNRQTPALPDGFVPYTPMPGEIITPAPREN